MILEVSLVPSLSVGTKERGMHMHGTPCYSIMDVGFLGRDSQESIYKLF